MIMNGQLYTTKLELIMDIDQMVVISITDTIHLDDNYSISRKKRFFKISVVPLRGIGGSKFFFVFREKYL
jgi:hypothetical protein